MPGHILIYCVIVFFLIDIFNSLLSLSLSLTLASKLPKINHSNSIPIGSLLASARDSDSESNELKMSNTLRQLNVSPFKPLIQTMIVMLFVRYRGCTAARIVEEIIYDFSFIIC